MSACSDLISPDCSLVPRCSNREFFSWPGNEANQTVQGVCEQKSRHKSHRKLFKMISFLRE